MCSPRAAGSSLAASQTNKSTPQTPPTYHVAAAPTYTAPHRTASRAHPPVSRASTKG
jgi:hypothetical protein